MNSSLSSVQSLLFQTLSKYQPLKSEVSGIYIDVPDNATSPYVALGEDTVINWGTNTFEGEEVTHTLHVWHETSPYKLKEVISLVIEALTQSAISISGEFSIYDVKREYIQVINDPGGWKHGVIRFNFKIKVT